MRRFPKFFLLAVAALQVFSAAALTPGGLTQSWTGSQAIPDNNASGVAFNFNFSAPPEALITDVEVSLKIIGGWNGDLYAYLSHGSGFTVLLNRPGRSASNLGGSGVSGLNLTLGDSYLTDVHTANDNPLTGNFAPDGRFVSPFSALDTDARSAFFSSFNSLDPNGNWTLFIADVAPLATSVIQGWSVNVSVVPEPGSLIFLGAAGVICLVQRNRRNC